MKVAGGGVYYVFWCQSQAMEDENSRNPLCKKCIQKCALLTVLRHPFGA